MAEFDGAENLPPEEFAILRAIYEGLSGSSNVWNQKVWRGLLAAFHLGSGWEDEERADLPPLAGPLVDRLMWSEGVVSGPLFESAITPGYLLWLDHQARIGTLSWGARTGTWTASARFSEPTDGPPNMAGSNGALHEKGFTVGMYQTREDAAAALVAAADQRFTTGSWPSRMMTWRDVSAAQASERGRFGPEETS